MACSLLYPPNGNLGQQAVLFGASFVGDADINCRDMQNVGTYGVIIQGGSNIRIRGNTISGASASAIAILGGISQFIITDNSISSTATITINAGASDHYVIANNLLNGVPILDLGTGTHKAIYGNDLGPVTLPGYVPSVKTTNYAATFDDHTIVFNQAGTSTLTLPAASTCAGRQFTIVTVQDEVVSASANVVPLAGGSAVTGICAAGAGNWATLQSNGTNWRVVAGTTVPSVATAQNGTYTVLPSDTAVVATGALTLTLYDTTKLGGQLLFVVNRPGGAVISASNNIIQLPSGTTANGILPPVAGAWAILQAEGGTGNWAIIAQSSVPTAPTIVTTASYTVLATDYALLGNAGGTITVTLPTPSTCPGRELKFIAKAAFRFQSAANNVVSGLQANPATGGNGITGTNTGDWSVIQSDGVSLWQTTAFGGP
jgi:hypothetical protein